MTKVLVKCVKYMTIQLPMNAFSLNFANFNTYLRFGSSINILSSLKLCNKSFHNQNVLQTKIDFTTLHEFPMKNSGPTRNFCTGFILLATKRTRKDRQNLLASVSARDEGNEGEISSSLDLGMNTIRGFGDIFPDETLSNTLFDGIRFTDLPVIHVKVSRNNTIMDVTDAKGSTLLIRSCGVEGFKNAKKGTNIAAQACAITLGTKAIEQGITNVRVKVKGLGPGRISAMKGLTMGGLNVVSISDVTPIPFTFYPRPRKAKKK